MGHSQDQTEALVTAIGGPMPAGNSPKVLPRTDALEKSQAAQDDMIASLQRQYNSLNIRENQLDGRGGSLETRTGNLESGQASQDALIAANQSAIAAVKAHDDAQDTAITAAAGAANAERLRNDNQDTRLAALTGRVTTLETKVAALEAWRTSFPLHVYGETPTSVGLTKITTAHPPLPGTLAIYVAGLRKRSADFTLVGSTATFLVALLAGQTVVVDYDYLPWSTVPLIDGSPDPLTLTP